MKPTPRQIARAEGRATYNTGKQCRNGHRADRYTANATCKACDRRLDRQLRPRLSFRAERFVLLIPREYGPDHVVVLATWLQSCVSAYVEAQDKAAP